MADLPNFNEAQKMLENFWPNALKTIRETKNDDFKNQELPLARIKRIMKLDEDASMMMISGEAPILFAKAAELFISELSIRGWVHTEESRRRTLQRNDIAMAISKYDMFDFLIDIVPREEARPSTASSGPTKQQNQNENVSILHDSLVHQVEPISIDTVTNEQLQMYIQQLQQQGTTVELTGNANPPMTTQLGNGMEIIPQTQVQPTTQSQSSPLVVSIHPVV